MPSERVYSAKDWTFDGSEIARLSPHALDAVPVGKEYYDATDNGDVWKQFLQVGSST